MRRVRTAMISSRRLGGKAALVRPAAMKASSSAAASGALPLVIAMARCPHISFAERVLEIFECRLTSPFHGRLRDAEFLGDILVLHPLATEQEHLLHFAICPREELHGLVAVGEQRKKLFTLDIVHIWRLGKLQWV